MILSKLRLFPAPEQRAQALATLRSVLGPTQAEPSCLAAQLYEEAGPEAAVLYLEEWESEREFQEHVRSALYRRVLAAIDLSQSAPETCFYEVATVHGLELIEQLRRTSEGGAPQASTEEGTPLSSGRTVEALKPITKPEKKQH